MKTESFEENLFFYATGPGWYEIFIFLQYENLEYKRIHSIYTKMSNKNG